MKIILIGLYILVSECVYIGALFLISYFFVKFFWNKEKVVDARGKVKIIEKEKPNKRYVCIVYVFLVISVLVLDILCAVMNMDVIVAHRIYPFEMEDTNIEGIYPRFLYNMQICGDKNNRDVKFNFLCWFNPEEIEKTIVRNDIKKNKTTYFEDKKKEVINENVVNTELENQVDLSIENVLENIVSDDIIENKIENVTNKIKK